MARCAERKSVVIAVLAAGLALSACGVRGDLQTPAPFWGERDRTPPEPPEAYETDADSDNPEVLIDREGDKDNFETE